MFMISSFVDVFLRFSCPGPPSLVWGVETQPEGGMNQMKIWKRGTTSRSRCRKESWWVAGPVCWVTKHKFQTFFLILAHRSACVSSGTNWKYNSRPSKVSCTFPLLLSLFQPPGDLWTEPFSSSALHFIYIFSVQKPWTSDGWTTIPGSQSSISNNFSNISLEILL